MIGTFTATITVWAGRARAPRAARVLARLGALFDHPQHAPVLAARRLHGGCGLRVVHATVGGLNNVVTAAVDPWIREHHVTLELLRLAARFAAADPPVLGVGEPARALDPLVGLAEPRVRDRVRHLALRFAFAIRSQRWIATSSKRRTAGTQPRPFCVLVALGSARCVAGVTRRVVCPSVAWRSRLSAFTALRPAPNEAEITVNR